ncbi:MAG: tetratricopeptide repeat protein, partial [Alphaproteobacteria bacterium]
VQAQSTATQTSFTFSWSETVAAAVFRRGESVWIVFDTPATMDIKAVPHVAPQFSKFEVIKGDSYSAIRIESPVLVPVTTSGGGSQWTVSLGGPPVTASTGVILGRDTESDTPGLKATLAGATRAIWIDDPSSGDKFIAVTALGPAKGLDARHRFADLDVLPSLQGVVIEPRAQDLTVDVQGDLVHIGKPQGLALSSPSAITSSLALSDGPQAASMPALVDFDNWSRLGPEGFYKRYDALRNAAIDESSTDAQASSGRPPQIQARMALARFLVGSDLEFEAIGVLDLVAKSYPQMLSDREFRGLRGAAKAMAGRYDDAAIDFASPVLNGEPSTALWRGYIAAKGGRWADARKAFGEGYPALGQVAPDWRARFARADAESAINLNDLKTAQTQLTYAASAGANQTEDLATSLWRGRLYQAQGNPDKALEIYDLVAVSPHADLSAAATLWAGKLRLSQAKITPAQAADIFDGLRFRWRGDAIEIETIRTLGQLDVSLGKYREALYALRSAVQRDDDVPGVAELQADLSNIFHSLFIDGKADGLQPLDALALWDDFAPTLAPIGAEGDQMVRN